MTAEYSMLPRANRERSRRDISKLKLAPRSAEIQRLVGRALRAAVDSRKPVSYTHLDVYKRQVKKYGGGLVCLTLDDEGIPADAQGRLAIAEKIVRRAEAMGIQMCIRDRGMGTGAWRRRTGFWTCSRPPSGSG